MNKYKVFAYDPKNTNIPIMINNALDAEKASYENEYLIFIQNDLIEKAIEPTKLYTSYTEFCDKLELPFAMYQYYNNFNRILPGKLNKVNPRIIIHTEKYGIFDLVVQSAYGFLIINTKVFLDNNFKFNEKYPCLFYIQDMIEQFYQKKLYLSNFGILEMHDSELLFKNPSDSSTGFFINMELYNKERELYFNENKPQYKNINELVEDLKKRYGMDATNSSIMASASGVTTPDQNQVSLVDIQKLINMNN